MQGGRPQRVKSRAPGGDGDVFLFLVSIAKKEEEESMKLDAE